MKPDIRIIFTDIDHTLYSHSKKCFDLPSINALKKVQKSGVLVYLATARPYYSIEQLGLFDYFTPDGIIASNGSVIFENDKVISSLYFDNEIVRKICKVIAKHHLTVKLSTEKNRFLAYKKNKYVDLLYQKYYEKEPPVQKYNNESICSINAFIPKKFDEVLIKELPKEVRYIRYSEYGVDITTGEMYKGKAVEKVLDYLKINKENTMAIGDDFADATMFFVRYAVAMGNAKDEVKELANYITDSIHESGVKNALIHFQLIENI